MTTRMQICITRVSCGGKSEHHAKQYFVLLLDETVSKFKFLAVFLTDPVDGFLRHFNTARCSAERFQVFNCFFHQSQIGVLKNAVHQNGQAINLTVDLFNTHQS